MQVIIPVAVILAVLLLVVLLRPWLLVKTAQGEVDRTRTNLRVVAIESWVVLAFAAVLPIVAIVEGKKGEPWFIAFLFIGTIGVFVHQILSQILKRLSELERAEELPETRPSDSTEKTT